jgi:hypothetical protein
MIILSLIALETMVNKVFLDDQGLLNISVIGDQSEETVREMAEKTLCYITLLRREHRPVLILDNIIMMGHATSDARREVGRFAKALDYDWGVMVGGGSLAMRYGTNLMLRAIGRSNLRYFTAIEPARRWLAGSHKI